MKDSLEEAKYNAYKEYWNENHTQEVKSNFLTAFKLGAKWQQEQTCDHNYILTSENGHRIIKCQKCNNTQPV